MSYVASVFLMFFEPEVYESGIDTWVLTSQKDAFWMLVIILERDLNGFYTNNMALLIENAALFQKMFDSHLPALATHLSHHKLDALLYH